jgi:hypothetical protein
MAFNIDEFTGHLSSQNEFAHANKFNVTIDVPGFLTSLNYGREIILSCENAEIPGVEINQIEFKHYSFTQRIPYSLTFAPVTFLFLCTGKMNEKIFFDTWADNMVPFSTGLLKYKNDNSLSTTITVQQFDNMGNAVYAAQLQEAYPISVSSLILNWSDESINKLQVTFAYKKWFNMTPGSDSPVATGSPIGAGALQDPSTVLPGVPTSSLSSLTDSSSVNNYVNDPLAGITFI